MQDMNSYEKEIKLLQPDKVFRSENVRDQGQHRILILAMKRKLIHFQAKKNVSELQLTKPTIPTLTCELPKA